MVAWIAFVLVFVALGLGVVFVAFRGGPRARTDRSGGPSRGGRRAIGVGTGVVIILIGIVVPGLVLAANSSDEKAPGGVALSDADVEGRQFFARNCSTCHSLRAANAVGLVGPDLDELRPPAALTVDAIAKGRARGQGQMPAGLLDGADARAVAGFIEKVAGR
jgi:mono/diheme cytochrome c family protein